MPDISASPIIDGNDIQNQDSTGVPKRGIVSILLLIAVIAIVGIGAYLIQEGCSAQQHQGYSTGEEYAISGYVKKAEKQTHRRGSSRHTNYEVDIKMTSDLPNGEREFKSHDFSDYSKVSDFSNMPNTLIDFTISADGYIADAKISPDDEDKDINWKDPQALSDFENLSEEEQHDKLFEIWKEKNGK